MKAMILAAGYGERMRPLTNSILKPLLPISDKPILYYTLQLLKKNGIFEVVINLHHLPDMIMDAFGDGSSFGMKIHYKSYWIPVNAERDNPTNWIIADDITSNMINSDILV